MGIDLICQVLIACVYIFFVFLKNRLTYHSNSLRTGGLGIFFFRCL